MELCKALYRHILGENDLHFKSPEHYLLFLCEGDFHCALDAREQVLPYGAICYVLPGQQLTLKALQPSAVLDLLEFELSPEEKDRFHSLPQPVGPTVIPNAPDLIPLFHNLHFLFHAADRWRKEKCHHVFCLIVYGTASGDEELFPNATKEERIAYRLRQLRTSIAKDPSFNITVADGAEFTGLQPSRFQQLYKKYFNISFGNDLIHFRIKQACGLLISTDWTAARIAAELGYSDENYFYRQFRKEMGITPNEYRKLSVAVVH